MAQNTDQAVGLVESIEGLVTVLHADGAETELALGSPLYLNDQITTGEYAAVSVRFVDKTSFSIGEDSRLIIDEYIYDPTTAKGKVDISVLKGMFVFISGLVADENPQNMTISTPGATIGIRGTEGGGEIGEAGESSYYFNADGIIEIITLIGSVIVDETMEVAVVSPNGTPILATGWTAEQIIETFVSALRVAPLEISQRIINADGNLNVDAREYMERLVQQAPDRDSADGASDDKDDQWESEDQGDADVQKDSGEEEGEESQAALSDGAKVEADSSAVALDISFAEDESQNQEDNPLAQQDLLNNSPENVVGAAASYVLEVDAINVDNTAPVFSSGATASVAENAGIDTIVYNAQANDAGGATDDGITYALSDADAFNINANNGEVTLKAPADFETQSSYALAITATDAAGNAATQTVTVSVTDVNDAPTLIGTPITTVAEDTAYSFIPTGADVDTDTTLTYSIAGKPDWATFNEETGELSGTPTNDDVGTTSGIVISVSDGSDTVSLPAFDLAVSNVNDAPTIIGTPDTTVAEDTAYSFIPTGADVDTDTTLTYSIAGKPDWADFNTTTGALTGTPTNADVGSTSGIVISVSDGTLTTPLQTFDLEVTNVNDAPTITGEPATSVAQDATYSFTPTGADVDTDTTLTYSIAGKPDWADFDTTTGALTGTPTNADVGTTSGIVISVSDGTLTTPLQTFNLAVTNTNDAPTIIGTPITTVAEDTAYSFIPTGADVDTDTTLTYSIAGKPDWADFNTTTGALTGTPTNADVGTTSGIVISVSDGTLTTPLQTFDLEVTNTNDAPVGLPTISGTATQGATLTAVTSGIVDVDGLGSFSYQWQADGRAIRGADETTFVPTQTQVGKAITVTVSYTDDGDTPETLTSAATSAVTDEIAPVFSSGVTASVAENAAVNTVVYNAQASDNNGAADVGITYALSGADAFNINADNGEVTLKAAADFESKSSYTLDVIATDAAGNAATQTVTVTVTDVDDTAPVFSSGVTASVAENAAVNTVVYNAQASDNNGAADVGITYTLSGTDANANAFNINAENGEVTLKVAADHETKDSYTLDVIATDAAGNAATQTVTVNVTDVDEIAPVFSSGDSVTVAENTDVNTPVYNAQTTDNNGAVDAGITYTLSGADANAFNINADNGEVTLKAAADFETKSSYALEVIATDAAGNAATQTVTVNVTDVDEIAPVFSSGDSVTVAENTPITTVVYNAQATDAGGANDEGITYSLSGADAGLFNINTDNGEVTLKAAADFESKSSYTLDVIATDAANNAATQSVTVNVTDVDEIAPVFSSGSTASLAENAAVNTVVYNAQASDNNGAADAGITYSLGGADANAFNINADNGEVTLKAAADFETKSSYTLDVIGTDAANNAATQSVTVNVTDVDEIAPVFSSGATVTVAENADINTPVYNAQATDNNGAADAGITYSLGGADANAFNINADNGEVTLKAAADFETKSSYTLDVIGTDAANNAATQSVTVNVTDVDEIAPVFSSGDSVTVAENTPITTVVYNAQATDAGGNADVGITYSLGGADANAFNINADNGEVTLKAAADFETKSSYTLDVIATDAAGNQATQSVTVNVTDVDEIAPVFSSGDSVTVAENTDVNTPVYNAQASDNNGAADAGITYSLGGADADAFNINTENGEVTLKAAADFESKSSYTLDVNATDAAGNVATQSVTVNVTDVDEIAPVFSSGDSVTVAENTDVNTPVYNAQATDNNGAADVGITYTLSGTDADAFNINTENGEVTLKVAADHETKSSYTLDVNATDATGNVATQSVTVNVTDVDEIRPVFSSGATVSVAENTPITTVVYNAQASDNNGAAGITYTLSGADDANAFNINAENGEVTLKAAADFESKPSYALEVIATDAAGNAATQAVTVTVTDVDDTVPVFSSGATASIPGNVEPGLFLVYDAKASDNNGAAGISYSLGGLDASDFTIGSKNGEVYLNGPNIKSNYAPLEVIATDMAGNAAMQTVTVTVTDDDKTVPVFSRGSAATASVAENASIDTVVYDAQARDALLAPDVNIRYELGGMDAKLFNINEENGEVTLKAAADYETKDSYTTLDVTAIDAAYNRVTQTVDVTVIDVDDVAFTFKEHRATDVALHTVSAAEGVAMPVFNFVHSDGEKSTISEDGNLMFGNSNNGEVHLTREGTISEVNNHGVTTVDNNDFIYTVEITDSAGTVEARTLQLVARVTESLAPYFVDSFGAPLALLKATAPSASDLNSEAGGVYSKVFSSPVYVADEHNGIFGFKDSSGKFVYSGDPDTLTRTPNTDLQDSGSLNDWDSTSFTFGKANSGLIFRFGDSDSYEVLGTVVNSDANSGTTWRVTNPDYSAVTGSNTITGRVFINKDDNEIFDDGVDTSVASISASSGKLVIDFSGATDAATDNVSALLRSLHFGYLFGNAKPMEIDITVNDGDGNSGIANDIDHTQDYSVAVV